MSYVVYARKSQESEERQIHSIDDQVALATELIEKQGLATYGPPISESFSAKEPFLRREFERMVKLIEAGRVDGIVAWHPDRLSRNETDAATICRLLRKGRLRDLKFVNYHFDNSPEGMMMLQMALSQSQYYSSKLSKDVIRGIDSKIGKGWWPGCAPEGYRNDLENHTIISDPDRLPLIARGFKLLLTGAYTVTDVVAIMNEEWGYRTRRRGKRIGDAGLSRTAGYHMFSNIFYTGRMLVRGQIVPGAHAAIITLSEFQDVQTSICRGNYKKRAFLFNGSIRCDDCGRAVVGELQRGRMGRGEYVYYRCGNVRCSGTRKCAKQEMLDQQVLERLRRVSWPSWIRDVLLDEARLYFRQELGDLEAMSSQEQRTLSNAIQRRSKLLDTKLDGDIDQATFRQKNEELTAEINRLNSSITTAKEKFDRAWLTVNRVCDFGEFALQTFESGSDSQRREILASLGAHYHYRDGAVTIDTNPLLPENLSSLQTSKSDSDKEKTGDFTPVNSRGWAGGTILQTLRLAIQGATFPELNYLR